MLYIYIYNLYIYIIFFWLGLFLIQSHTMVAGPSPCTKTRREGGAATSACVWAPRRRPGTAACVLPSAGLPGAARGRGGGETRGGTRSVQEIWLHGAQRPGGASAKGDGQAGVGDGREAGPGPSPHMVLGGELPWELGASGTAELSPGPHRQRVSGLFSPGWGLLPPSF